MSIIERKSCRFHLEWIQQYLHLYNELIPESIYIDSNEYIIFQGNSSSKVVKELDQLIIWLLLCRNSVDVFLSWTSLKICRSLILPPFWNTRKLLSIIWFQKYAFCRKFRGNPECFILRGVWVRLTQSMSATGTYIRYPRIWLV